MGKEIWKIYCRLKEDILWFKVTEWESKKCVNKLRLEPLHREQKKLYNWLK